MSVPFAAVPCRYCQAHFGKEIEAGRAAGYPECCVQWYVNVLASGQEPARLGVSRPDGYVPCPAHGGAAQ